MSSFFFSSRRRHTRYIGDWSSDVCSSDLDDRGGASGNRSVRGRFGGIGGRRHRRRSEERRVGKSVEIGRCRSIKKEKQKERKGVDKRIEYAWEHEKSTMSAEEQSAQ